MCILLLTVFKTALQSLTCVSEVTRIICVAVILGRVWRNFITHFDHLSFFLSLMALCCVLPCTCERNSIQIVLEFAAQLLVYLVYLKAQEGRDPDHD